MGRESPSVEDLTGVKGQGNPNPYSDFLNHQLLIIKGQVFDPSYGKRFESIRAWEEASVKAFLVLDKIKKNGEDIPVIKIRKNETHESDFE